MPERARDASILKQESTAAMLANRWGGVCGCHSFVDPAQKLTVIVPSNTAVAGMAGAFPDALQEAVYGRRTQ